VKKITLKYKCILWLLILIINSQLLHAQNNLNTFDFVVSKDGSTPYSSLQEVLNQIPSGNLRPYKIFIKKGVYQEVITIDASKSKITLVGENENNTFLQFDNHAGITLPNGDTLNTWTCASVFVYGNDFQAQNISFSNQAGFNAGQAVALRVEGNRASFINCRMLGFQDVLFLSGNGVKQYFKDCYIEGTTDFIFGASTALFENCHIHSKKNSHVTAAATNSIIPFGFVFKNCKLTADSIINKVSLGRPWTPTASVIYMNCWLGAHIIGEGWNNWKNPANESTVRYFEYKSSGPGANPSKRVPWGKQLTDEQANILTTEKILGNWRPLEN
jgi:pectinesterase